MIVILLIMWITCFSQHWIPLGGSVLGSRALLLSNHDPCLVSGIYFLISSISLVCNVSLLSRSYFAKTFI